jgi:hypothetical protein
MRLYVDDDMQLVNPSESSGSCHLLLINVDKIKIRQLVIQHISRLNLVFPFHKRINRET